MTSIEKIIQTITVIIAGITFVWSVISVFLVYNQNKKLKKLQGGIDRGNHVSKVVFDKIFLTFESLAKIMFDCYNVAGREMFPFYDDAKNSIDNPKLDINKMIEVEKKAINLINKFIEILEINRFILSGEILEKLSNFEIKMKVLKQGYSNKIEQLENFSKKEEKDMLKFAEELQEDYKYISDLCNDYIQQLQIVD